MPKTAPETALDKTKETAQSSGPELVIGLIGPVGTDLTMVIDRLENNLRRVKYTAVPVRLSELLKDVQAVDAASLTREDDRINALMQAGDDLRSTLGYGGALALFAVAEIRRQRLALQAKTLTSGGQAENMPVPRTAYILNSLKHPGEVEALRKVYGPAFVALGIYHPRTLREEALMERIARVDVQARPSDFRDQAAELVARDEHTSDNDLGQNVRKAFPQADIFINQADLETLDRVIDVLFGDPFKTPTRTEFGMFHARASALRSADLSRQVGAVIANQDGEILALGCNEVPKAGGGAYWEGDLNDSRDFQKSGDTNATTKRIILAEILDELKNEGWLSDTQAAKNVEDLLRDAEKPDPTGDRTRPMFENARVSALLEFGRIVHAEMNALLDAARRGVSVKGATLYCTTFPCHVCARHIIGAGIEKVVYIEPYPKSMASEMYEGAIVVEGQPEKHHADAVTFEAFVGVAPSRYMELFTRARRKLSDGAPIPWQAAAAQPENLHAPAGVYDLETALCAGLAAHCTTHDTLPADHDLFQVLARARKIHDKWLPYQKQAVDVGRILGWTQG